MFRAVLAATVATKFIAKSVIISVLSRKMLESDLPLFQRDSLTNTN